MKVYSVNWKQSWRPPFCGSRWLDMDKAETKKPRLLTLKQAAELIDGLTEYRIRLLCTENLIKYHKFGNKYMIPERELLKHFGEST
jgi:hypothetical protein